ncbi:copper resistance CopC family protein [Kiloniella sp. b19]|uniref:copper resistance CopC family protein n=1 Tax=Kiloniella sp. GXU_MW_B19 TaxID=3141326 RepID=UPI0031DECFAE
MLPLSNVISSLALVLMMSLVFSQEALSHAKGPRTSPEAGQVLEALPQKLEMEFNQEVILTRVQLVLPDGRKVALPLDGLERSSKHALSLEEAKAGKGQYQVLWKALSADGHPVKGAFDFGVE